MGTSSGLPVFKPMQPIPITSGNPTLWPSTASVGAPPPGGVLFYMDFII